MTINIDLQRDDLLTEVAIATMKDRYLTDDETSPQEAFARAAEAFADDTDHAQRIYDYVSRGWFMYSTPILSNGGTEKGLPIACFGGFVADDRGSITEHYTENAWLSSMGGGIGGYWGKVRADGQATSRGSKSTGTIPFIKVVDSQMLAFSQGSSRRGSYAAYMPIDHPEIEEFMAIRKPTGGDVNRKSINLNNAVTIPDSFMRKITGEDEDTSWRLVDPNSREVTKVVDARDLWQQLLNLRVETGEPYIMFTDTVNAALPETMKEKGLHVHQSNLCSEITLPTNIDRTFVCCLSSVNLEKYDEWVSTTMISDLVRFLDNVLTSFIEKAPDPLYKAVYSAQQERSIGLGAMGFHAYLQKNSVPWESAVAKSRNTIMFKEIQQQAIAESRRLAEERGEAPDMKGTGMRNAHLMAVAPNATSSLLCGTSPGIEPTVTNSFTQKTLSGSFSMKNPWLRKKLLEAGKDTPDIWKSITANGGSVQHLDFLSDWDKDVFKTANEIDQRWLVDLAADRQKYICQSQSLNLFFVPDSTGKIDAKYIHQVHLDAWEKGCKTLYYVRSRSRSRVENIEVKVERKTLGGATKSPAYEETTCLACES